MTETDTTTALQDELESMYEKYTLHHPAEIRARLRQIVDKRCLLLVRGPGTDDVVTAALTLGEHSLWVDVPRDPAVAAQLQKAERLRFESAIDRVGVRFTTGAARPGTYEGLPALEVALPEKLIHLQRREYVRREPITPLACTLKVADLGGQSRTVTANVADIGGGGIAMVASDAVMEPEIGDVLPDVVLELPDDGPLVVRLRVQHLTRFEQHGRRMWRAGCQFIELNAHDESRVLRYVMHLDRQHAVKRRERDF